MKSRLRTSAVVVSSALALTGLTLAAAPAQAADPDPRPQSIAADWIAGELVDGLLPSQFAGFPDYGLTIDAGLGLIEAGGHGADVDAISDALAPKVADGYAEASEYDDEPPYDLVQKGIYAGSVAKALVFADAAGISDPAAWSGADLLGDLESRVSAAAPTVGRISDDSSYGDYANTFGQAFAVNALDAAGSPKAAPALAFLLKQQCASGYFRLYFTADKAATDQTCDGGRASGASNPDPDSTALAIRMLLPQIDDAAVARAIGKAEGWLIAQQRADGSFTGGTGTDTPNTNSTGLAGWALGELGDDAAATRAASWIRGRQADEVGACANGLSGETGAVGYDDAAVTTALSAGIPAGIAPQWRRSTAAVVPALAWAPDAAVSLQADGPDGYVQAGRAATVTVSGALPGGKLCLTGTGSPLRAVADADGDASLSKTLPAGTGTRTYTVADRDGNTDQVAIKALGATTFAVAVAPRTAARNTLVKFRATGLAAGEKVRLAFRGVTLRTGTANANGVFAGEFNVRRTLGKGTLAVFGQFAGRRGSAVVTVVR